MVLPTSQPAPRTLLPPLLAPREREVLQAYAEGLSSSEIAARLSTDVETVHASLQAALRNLGACTRLEAILVAVSRGLLELGQQPGEGEAVRARA